MSWFTLLLAVGATVRLSRLFTLDTFPPTKALRFRIFTWSAHRHGIGDGSQWDDDTSAAQAIAAAKDWWPVKLSVCPWCLSFWIAIPVMVLAWFIGGSGWFLVPAAILSASHISGLAAGDK